MTLRTMILTALVCIGLLTLEFLLWIVWPRVGSACYFFTLVCLQLLEAVGLPTLKGSSSGWPLPTTLGWGFAVLARLALYFAVVSIIVRLCKRTAHGHQTA